MAVFKRELYNKNCCFLWDTFLLNPLFEWEHSRLLSLNFLFKQGLLSWTTKREDKLSNGECNTGIHIFILVLHSLFLILLPIRYISEFNTQFGGYNSLDKSCTVQFTWQLLTISLSECSVNKFIVSKTYHLELVLVYIFILQHYLKVC